MLTVLSLLYPQQIKKSIESMPMPFDGKRLIYGGFEKMLDE